MRRRGACGSKGLGLHAVPIATIGSVIYLAWEEARGSKFGTIDTICPSCMGGLQICLRAHKREILSVLLFISHTYLQKQKLSKQPIKSNMKFPDAVLSVAFSTIVHAATIPRPDTGLLNSPCTPGEYICAQKGYARCGYSPAIVRISTQSSLLLIVRANSILQVICDPLGYSYQIVACCAYAGCEVINGAPHCM